MNEPSTDFNMSDLQVDARESSIEMDTMWECDTNPNQKGRIDAPTYSNNFNTVLQDPEKEVPVKLNNAPLRNSCFNCMGGHLISECPLPRDQRAITKNRREFMNKSSGFFRQASRYHLGEDQMYAHMVPGQISKSLRQALGLSRNQLPLHVYRMRLFGYPPGWLEDARVSRSGIALYVDSQGNEIPSLDDEEGEIITDGSKDTYDVSKIHEFPGFNVPPDPDIIDESRCYYCPPQRQDQSKEAMVQNLELRSATASSYKKRASIPMHAKPDVIIIDSDGDPNSHSTPVLPGGPSEDADTKGQDRCGSPSLEDLEAQKQSLMAELLRKSAAAELACNSNDMDIASNDCKEIASVVHVDHRTLLSSVDEDTVHSELDTVLSDAINGDRQSNPKDLGVIKHVELGTPTSDQSMVLSDVVNEDEQSNPKDLGVIKNVELGTPTSDQSTVLSDAVNEVEQSNPTDLGVIKHVELGTSTSVQSTVLSDAVNEVEQSNPMDLGVIKHVELGTPTSDRSTVLSDAVNEDEQFNPKDLGVVKHVELGTPTSDRSTPYSRSATPVTKIGMVKQVEQGTPILKSASPYSLLPSPDKFSKGICDVINFENLPDSLGHYKRMNEVIHSVRNHLKRQ